MKTIFNTYVLMESQEQCNRMRKICVKFKLKCFNKSNLFLYDPIRLDRIFAYAENYKRFYVYRTQPFPNKSKVSESEWLELLANHLELKVNQE